MWVVRAIGHFFHHSLESVSYNPQAPTDTYLTSLLIHLLPLLPTLSTTLVRVLLARRELLKLEQLLRANVLPASRETALLLDLELDRAPDLASPATPESPELEIDRREQTLSTLSSRRTLLLSLRHDIARRLAPAHHSAFALEHTHPLRAVRIAAGNGTLGNEVVKGLLEKAAGDPVALYYLRAGLEKNGFLDEAKEADKGTGTALVV
jgi:hypothetical protein